MERFKRAALGAAFFAFCSSAAMALPGDTFAGLKARMLAHHAFKTTCGILTGELSGTPYCDSVTRIDGAKVTFEFYDHGTARASSETIDYKAHGFNFGDRTDPRARAVVAAVYGPAIARDFATARPGARVRTYRSEEVKTFFLGRRFGYESTNEANFHRFNLIPRSRYAGWVKQARVCGKEQCETS